MARRSPDLDEFYIESRTRRFFRRMSRRVRRLFYLLVFLAIAAVIAGPNLLSTDQARNLIIDRINERIPGSISIESMYLSWLGTQSMGGVELRGPDKRLIARIGELRVETGLVQLLSEKDNFGTIRMVAPQATLIFDESGHSNLDDALGFKQEKLIELANTSSKDGSTKEALKVRVPFRGSLMIESGQLTVVQPEVEKITFSGITATVQFASRQGPLVFAVNAKSKQGELSGEIDVEVLASGFNQAGEFRVLGTSEGLYKTDEGAELDVKAKLTNLPLDAIDRLASINAPERRGVLTRALGSRMDVQADVMVDADNIEADIQAGSPTLRARVLGETTAGHFVLKEPGQLSVQVTPTFFDDVAKALRMPPGLRLRETSTLLFKIKELNLPLQEGQTDLADLIVDTEVSFEDAQLVGDVAFGELVLRNTHATLATRALSKELILAFSSDVEHNGNPSTLSAHMNLANVVEANGTYTPESITGDLSLTAQGVSVQVMDQWLGFQGVLVEALGTKLDFTLETQINGQSSLMTLGFKAGDLSVEGAKIEVTDRVHLLNPVEVDYRFSAALANRFLKPTWNVALSQDVPLRASISNFSFPKPQPEGQLVQLKDIVLEAAVQLEKAHVEGVHELDGITAEKVELDFVGENLADTLVHFQGAFLPDNQESWIVDFGGQRFNVVGAMKLRETAQGAVDFVNASFDVQSDKVAFKLEGDLEDYDYMRLAKPIDLKFTLLPEHSKRLGLDHPELPVIASPAPVHVVLDPFETSLSKFDPYAMRFAGQVDFGRMGLTFPGRDYLSVLEEGKVDWRFSGPDKIFQVQADAKAMTESGGQQQKGEFTLELLVGDLLTADNGLNTQGMQLLLKTEGKALPTPLVEAVTGLPYLKDLFGQDMTGVFNTKLKQVYPPVGAVAFKLEGEPILVEGTFVLDKMVRLLDPRRPAYLKWKVTPDRYQVLKKFVALLSGEAEEAIADLELVQPTEMEFFAKRLSLPAIWFHRPYGGMTIQVEDQVVNTSDWDASQLSLDFDLGFKDLNFRSPKLDQTLRFNELKGFIAMPSITEKLVFGVLAEGQLSGAATGEEPSVVTIKGQLWDLVEGEDKQIQFKTASTKLWATLSNVPATLLGDFFVLPKTAKEHLQAFFGEKLNAYVQADLDRMAGPITAKLDSSHTKGDLEAELIDGALLLKNDLEFAIDVTPDTGEQILRYFNPLLITAIKADKPLEVRVTAKGFKLPVIPLDIAGAQFADATVSIGKVTMRNDGPMGSLVKVLQLTRFTDSKDLEVWFTPLYLAMEDGVLTVKRVDFLVADHFHMATWGKMDLAKDRLGLVAGLSGDTLRSAFKIKGLPDTYVLQIPLKGTFSKPKIDEKKAVAKISALYLQAYGGDKTRLMGGIIEKFTEDREYSEVPTPTTDPFPWGTRDPLILGEQEFAEEPGHPDIEHADVKEEHEYSPKEEKVRKNIERFRIFMDQLKR